MDKFRINKNHTTLNIFIHTVIRKHVCHISKDKKKSDMGHIQLHWKQPMLLGDVNVCVEYFDGNSETEKLGTREKEKKRKRKNMLCEGTKRCSGWASEKHFFNLSMPECGEGVKRYTVRKRNGRNTRKAGGERKVNERKRKHENWKTDRHPDRQTKRDTGRERLRERETGRQQTPPFPFQAGGIPPQGFLSLNLRAL